MSTASTISRDPATAPTRRRRSRSIRRDRLWALRLSYVFLFLFAAFFLVPPFYMLVTSLKTSAEISGAANPWWVSNPTLGNYAALLGSGEFLIFFRNSAVVSVVVVVVTMLISIPAAFALSRMRFWGSATLAMGVFLTYLIPETLLFIPLFKIFAAVNEATGIQLLDNWWVLIILYPTLTVPFCTWIMIGYFASIPKELDEASPIPSFFHRWYRRRERGFCRGFGSIRAGASRWARRVNEAGVWAMCGRSSASCMGLTCMPNGSTPWPAPRLG